MRRFECNQIFESTEAVGSVACKFRCTLTKFGITEKTGKFTGTVKQEKVRDTIQNHCRLKSNQSKKCSHPNDNEHTCNVARRS